MISARQEDLRSLQQDFRYFDRSKDYGRSILSSRQIDGLSSVELLLSFPRHTLVRQYDLIVTAAETRGNSPASALGQVRASDANGTHTVVIDFGTPRTVRGVQISQADGATISSIQTWTGAKFADPFEPTDLRPLDDSIYLCTFATEIRSDRLMLTLDRQLADPDHQLSLDIPDLPADLELRINDGPPVWTHPGPVQANAALSAPTSSDWNQAGTRLVPLSDALNALLADPVATDDLSCRLVLSAKVPGRLALAAADAAHSHLSYIHRAGFGNASNGETSGDHSHDLDFEAEGLATLALPMPAGSAPRRVEALRLTALAKLSDSRTLPPLGPTERLAPDGLAALAEIALDSSHAAIVRLDSTGLAQLSGLRLPLASEAEGAEIRVVLWQADPATGAPASALDAGTSEIVTLAPQSHERWYSFAFKTPVDLGRHPSPWAALVVSRGTVLWRLADTAQTSGETGLPAGLGSGPPLTPAGGTLRRGPASGPWRPLPTLLEGPLLQARGRTRVVGTADKTRPIAALGVSLNGVPGNTELSPSAKGSTATLSFDPPVELPAGDPVLRLISRVAGSVTLRDIELIWTETPPSPAT